LRFFAVPLCVLCGYAFLVANYICGDPLADFTAPELPKKESTEKKADEK